MARGARQALPLLLAAVAAAATAARMAAARSPARSAVELHSHYYDIFPSRNRNAASHKWVTHVLRDATELRRSELESVLSGFCAVSGSPVRPTKYNRYRYRLPLAGGGAITGDTYHCCWPCVCDVEDFLMVDYVDGVVTRDSGPDGEAMPFLAMGDPCANEEALMQPFIQPFDRRETTLWREAPEVRCEGGKLRGATYTRRGLVAIGVFALAEDEAVAGDGLLSMDGSYADDGPLVVASPQPGRVTVTATGLAVQLEGEYATQCYDRELAGFNSGMGEIFRRVAAINPPKLSAPRCESEGVCLEPAQ